MVYSIVHNIDCLHPQTFDLGVLDVKISGEEKEGSRTSEKQWGETACRARIFSHQECEITFGLHFLV